MSRTPMLLCAILLFVCVAALSPQPPARAQERCFPQTGQCLAEPFRAYWERGGGLPLFGFPISAPLWEDGRLVQYFERNRFEWHPENPPASQVLLGRLGAERLVASGRDWRAMQRGQPAPGCRFFPETGHSLCGAFLSYWQRAGGLAVFGYPLTEPLPEQNEADGRVYTVQYFERNRFEWHPENPPASQVLLGLLGSWRAGWLLGEARTLPAHPARAEIRGPDGPQRPLALVTLGVSASGYSGPAELRVFDGAGREQARLPLELIGGVGSATLTAAGALGPHAAALLIDGRLAGATGTAYTLDAQTSLSTGLPRYDDLLVRVRDMLAQDVLVYTFGDTLVRGYRSPDSDMLWLRDHVHQAQGFRYFERDMTSMLDFFRGNQAASGAFDDYVGNPRYGAPRARTEVEADLEYLFVQGVYQAWQATGDDGWLRASLPAMERGLAYSTSHPQRWEPSLGLLKRPFTIDTWDFEYGGPTISPDGKLAPRHWIDSQTKWSIMHGDNTGLAYAMQLMARIDERMGDGAGAARWREQAAALMQRLNNTSWNGTFYTHQVPLVPFELPGVDMARQLSLSNAYALNREVLTPVQANAILGEYQRRYQNRGEAFAEWYSIDPPFPADSFGTEQGWGKSPGEYVNGGIMPLVGGELSRGAFRWGDPRYGFDILDRYYFLIRSQGGSYLWYYPAGNPGKSSPSTISTDGWGSSAMLAALIEGAAGVTDQAALFRTVEIAPRWAADPEVAAAELTLRYPASLGYVAYRWERLPDGLRLRVSGPQSGPLRLLLPEAAPDEVAVTVGGAPVAFRLTREGSSRYVELALPASPAPVEVRWQAQS
ncbi:MAG: hypothetical protein OHK0022_60160 [Roseiflexaceae bacterium]